MSIKLKPLAKQVIVVTGARPRDREAVQNGHLASRVS